MTKEHLDGEAPKLPREEALRESSRDELRCEIEKGLRQADAGELIDMEEAFARLRAEI